MPMPCCCTCRFFSYTPIPHKWYCFASAALSKTTFLGCGDFALSQTFVAGGPQLSLSIQAPTATVDPDVAACLVHAADGLFLLQDLWLSRVSGRQAPSGALAAPAPATGVSRALPPLNITLTAGSVSLPLTEEWEFSLAVSSLTAGWVPQGGHATAAVGRGGVLLTGE
jgi:hypothetical protein